MCLPSAGIFFTFTTNAIKSISNEIKKDRAIPFHMFGDDANANASTQHM